MEKFVGKDLWEDHDLDGKEISLETARCCYIYGDDGDCQGREISGGELMRRPGTAVGCRTIEEEEEVVEVGR
jgi:hypothetical protein